VAGAIAATRGLPKRKDQQDVRFELFQTRDRLFAPLCQFQNPAIAEIAAKREPRPDLGIPD
jgi:hypothetical protein